MKTLYLNIAECVIQMTFDKSDYPDLRSALIGTIQSHYAGFIIKRPSRQADYSVHFIDSTKEVSFYNHETGNGYLYFYHRDQNTFETYYYASVFEVQTLFFEILLEHLDKNGDFIMHASGNVINGKAYLFLGKSGAGKSTIMTFLNRRYPAYASDSVIIKKTGRTYYAYQTPFFEKETWVKRKAGKTGIGGMFFISKAKQCSIKKAPDKSVLNGVIGQVLKHRRKESDMVGLVMKFIRQNPVFMDLYFPRDEDLVTSFFNRLFSSRSSFTASTNKAMMPE